MKYTREYETIYLDRFSGCVSFQRVFSHSYVVGLLRKKSLSYLTVPVIVETPQFSSMQVAMKLP